MTTVTMPTVTTPTVTTMSAESLADLAAPLAVAERSGWAESVHHGVAVAIDEHGVVAAIGEPTAAIYPRSALKPLQAAAMCAAGLELEPPLLALACASHDGSDEHIAAVRELLGAFGFAEDDLQNTPARPYAAAARNAARLRGVAPSSIQQNCSGKHAAMLATCRINGWPTEGYLAADHPLQRTITAWIADHGCRVEHVGVDGCGAPTHVLHLDELARAVAALATARHPVAVAMAEHPEMVGGPDRDVTQWMRAVPGLVAKDGADGVMVLARDDGRAAALKIADGSDRARRAATIEAARQIGVDLGAVGDVAAPPTVLGHGEAVGVVHALNWTPWSS